MPLNAGPMDQRITIQRRVDARNAMGENAYTWQDVATVWARAEPLRGREWFAAAQMQATADVRFTIRYRADLDATMRVLWQGQPHDIVAPPIDVAAARETLELMCLQGVRDGR